MSRRLCHACAILLCLALLAPRKAHSSPFPRHGWFVGLGLGVGKANNYGIGGTLRVGRVLGPRWGLGVETHAVTQFSGGRDLGFPVSTPSLASGELTLRLYSPNAGLTLVGGVGWGSAALGESSIPNAEGRALQLGGQYELPMGTRATWGPEAAYVWLDAPRGYQIKSHYYVAGLGTTFYLGAGK